MLQHWRANVDLQIILDAHVAITYMTKYAAKGEKAEGSLQNIVKTVVQSKYSTDNASTAIRSAIIRSVGNRDIGQGETSRILFSGHHCKSSLSFVTVSIDLKTQEIEVDQNTGNLFQKKSLLQWFSIRNQLAIDPKYQNFELHREFGIPIQQSRFTQLKGAQLRDIQENPHSSTWSLLMNVQCLD
jgi:hypothetical protein